MPVEKARPEGGNSKREFKDAHGFWPHEERCTCGIRRASHTVWNTDRSYDGHDFAGTGEKA
jgi:hypothetical protein